jgi:DNA-binding MarR family transcriptional regulator
VSTDSPPTSELHTDVTGVEKTSFPKPRAHGGAVTEVFADLAPSKRNAPRGEKDTLYDAALHLWVDEIGDPDLEPYPVVDGFDPEWLPEPTGEWVVLQSSSRWKAGTGTGSDYSAYHEQHLKIRDRIETTNGVEYQKPPVAMHVEIMPQYPGMVYKSGDELALPHGEGSRMLAWTTWAESASEIERRAYDVLRAAYGPDVLDIERDRVEDSRRVPKAEAHLRFDVEKKGAVVETVNDSKDLIDYGGVAEIEARSRRQREGWLECIVESDRWDSLGFAEKPFSTEVKVYQHSNWDSFSEDDPLHHPKLEASFAGVDRGPLPHVSEFDDVLDHLRRIVATHSLWAGVERGNLVADDYFDGPAATPWSFERPTGRREMLRQRYEDVATTVFMEAASKLTTAVHDVLSVVVQENGATYDQLVEKTGLARSTVRYHVARLAEKSVLKRVGNPVVVCFESWNLRDRAREKIREARPDRTREDIADDAEQRRQRRNGDEDAEEVEPDDLEGSDDVDDGRIGFRYLAGLDVDLESIRDEYHDGRLDGEDIRIRVDALRERLR